MTIQNNNPPASTRTQTGIHWAERTAIGIMGGFAAAASKIIGLDAQIATALLSWDMLASAHELKVMILIHTPILMTLGGILAYLVDENVRIKIFAIGVSAPALITPWLSNPVIQPINDQRASLEWLEIVPSAWAQDQSVTNPQSIGRLEGLEYLLRFNNSQDPERRYWVIAGSHTDIREAEEQVAKIKAAFPELDPFLGLRKEGNPFYPVIIGGKQAFLPLQQARALQKKADALGSLAPSGTYLSDYPERVPPQ